MKNLGCVKIPYLFKTAKLGIIRIEHFSITFALFTLIVPSREELITILFSESLDIPVTALECPGRGNSNGTCYAT
jgi:hypothetical protein